VILISALASDKNRLSTLRPDLIKYFKNQEDADRYSISSGRYANLICPNCGTPKKLQPNSLTSRGFSCSACSDGISIPNKFMYNIIKDMNIDFDTERVFYWAQNKKYDFYIPSINVIIEMHGIQHYKNKPRSSGRNLQEEQENDALKERMAKENGINNYVIIDARKSELEWLKENCINKLSSFFDLKNVNWNLIYKNCANSLMLECCNMYKNGKEVDYISKTIKLHSSTIYKYLKRGNKIGIIKYTPHRSKGHVVYQFTRDGVFKILQFTHGRK